MESVAPVCMKLPARQEGHVAAISVSGFHSPSPPPLPAPPPPAVLQRQLPADRDAGGEAGAELPGAARPLVLLCLGVTPGRESLWPQTPAGGPRAVWGPGQAQHHWQHDGLPAQHSRGGAAGPRGLDLCCERQRQPGDGEAVPVSPGGGGGPAQPQSGAPDSPAGSG